MEVDWGSETNWTVASGSLRHCITFQSSLSLFNDDETSQSTPLILHPSDSVPCEIKINFAEKHELRQVYVRSTGRVYEIYCAPNLQTNNDYLCTVRCGPAVRDGEVLRSPVIQDLTDDDWVEVRVVDKPYINSTRTSQDLYEATAEIDDANPCVSVTLRLLSLQNKGCVYVDEIYVFADPVDAADSESQESRNDNSSGSSLMAMFLPSLMQLSKTPGHLDPFRKDKQHDFEGDLKATHLSNSVIKTQLQGKASIADTQDVKLNEVKGGLVGLSRQDTVPSQAPKMDSSCSVMPSKIVEMENNQGAVPESNHIGSLGGNVERALEQLVSRMDRIEEICLGFQERMVMPMSSIEARLQRVEQQLDTLSKKVQNSVLPSCYRISAPDASCIESNANSCDNCLDYTVARESESDKKHLHTEGPHITPHDLSGSANTAQLLPGLVVTAPEFPDGEDEEGNVSGQETNSLEDKGKQSIDDPSEQETNSSKDKGKQSIDDALSSALANFVSSSMSIESPKHTKSLIVKAPEFSNEDDDDHESDSEIVNYDSIHLADNDELSDELSHTQVLAPSNISLESGEKVNTDSNGEHSEKTGQEAEECDQFCSAEGDQNEVCHNPRTGFIDNFDEDKGGKINHQKSDGLLDEKSDGLLDEKSDGLLDEKSDGLLNDQTPCAYCITREGPSATAELNVETEVQRKTFHENIIKDVLGFSFASSAVDFEIPLLDVKFISQKSSIAERFIEDLLVETQNMSSKNPSVKESNDDLSVMEQVNSNGDLLAEEQSNLISIEDGEPVNPASDSHYAVDKDLCAWITAPVNIDGDDLQLPEDHKRKHDLMSYSCFI